MISNQCGSKQAADCPSATDIIHSLQEYVLELQKENATLKSHIFRVQNEHISDKRGFHDDLQRLRLYSQQLENEIMKREQREINLLEGSKDLVIMKEQVERERDNYIIEIQKLKEELRFCSDKRNSQRKTTQHYQDSIKQRGNSHLTRTSNSRLLKCTQCAQKQWARGNLQSKILAQQGHLQELQKDLRCLTQFIS